MDLNDYPTQSKALPWKPIALATGSVLLAFLVVFVAIRVWKDGDQASALDAAVGPTAARAIERTCEGAQDPQTCLSSFVAEVEQATELSEACEQEKAGEARDNCYWGVARDTGQQEVCRFVSDEGWSVRCHDDVLQAHAFELREVTLCEQMQDASRREGCTQAFAPAITSATCDWETQREICSDLEAQEAALSALDASKCDTISDTSRYGTCLDFVATAINEGGQPEPAIEESDTDGDGLMDLDELVTYQTDPLNPDTDGDGYQDGAEVVAGYDPNGLGRLGE